MKRERKTNKIQRNLIVIFVITVGMIILGIMFGTKTMAAPVCESCGTNQYMTILDKGKETHSYQCGKCTGVTTEKHKYDKAGDTTCTVCGATHTHVGYPTEYESWYQELTQHSRYHICDTCGCLYYPEQQLESHTFSGGKCTKCNYTCTHSKATWGFFANITDDDGHEIHYECVNHNNGCTYIYKTGNVISHEFDKNGCCECRISMST